MKYSLVTMKPNTMRKTYFSKLLKRSLRIEVSMKANRCILKKGGIDQYLLETKPSQIDSKFGLLLRDRLIEVQKDPASIRKYIPGTATVPKTRKKQYWEYHNKCSIFVPVNVRTTVDLTKYYIRSPNEMTRSELAELEKELREIEEEQEAEDKLQNPEGVQDAEDSDDDKEDELTRGKKKRMIRKAQKEQNAKDALLEDSDDEEDGPKKFEIPDIQFTDLDRLKYLNVKGDPAFVEYVKQLKALMPMRNGIIRRYFEKYKYQKKKREAVLAAALESEEFIAKLMGDKYVPLLDQMPEIRDFMQEMQAKEAEKLKAAEVREIKQAKYVVGESVSRIKIEDKF